MEFKKLEPKYSEPINQENWNELITEPARAFEIYFNHTGSSEFKQEYINRQEQQQIEAVREIKDSEYES